MNGKLVMIAGIFSVFFACEPCAAEVGLSKTIGTTGIPVASGYNALSVSLVKPALAHGTLLSFSPAEGGYVEVLGNSVDIAAWKTGLQGSMYLELIANGRKPVAPGVSQVLPVQGHRFEVNVAATVNTANNRIQLLAGSPANTVWPPPELTEAEFVIRGHVTIGDVFGKKGNVLLRGTGLASTSDRISFYDNPVGKFRTFWFRKNAAGTIAEWRSLDDVDTTDYTNQPLYPGTGILLYRQPDAGATTLHHLGLVRENPIRLPLPAGYSLVSHSRPLDHSPAMARMFQGSGWVSGADSSTSDQIHIWNGTTPVKYWFRSVQSGLVQQWRNVSNADSTDYMNQRQLIPGDRGIWMKKLTADVDYLMDLQPGGNPPPSP